MHFLKVEYHFIISKTNLGIVNGRNYNSLFGSILLLKPILHYMLTNLDLNKILEEKKKILKIIKKLNFPKQ